MTLLTGVIDGGGTEGHAGPLGMTVDARRQSPAGFWCLTPRPWQLHDPARLLTEISERFALVEGTALLALILHPSTEQKLVGVEGLRSPALLDDWDEASEEIYERMQQFDIPDRPRRPEHCALTVVVRDGLCVLGPNEGQWYRAWRYSNHLRNAFDGGLILVTRRAYTRTDLDTMPDDGRRYELIDGTLLVTTSPSLRHQAVSSNLIRVFHASAPAALRVLHAPLDLVIDEATVLQPDLLVVPSADLHRPEQPLRPLLVVEILSPATRRVDLTLKRSQYEAGVSRRTGWSTPTSRASPPGSLATVSTSTRCTPWRTRCSRYRPRSPSGYALATC